MQVPRFDANMGTAVAVLAKEQLADHLFRQKTKTPLIKQRFADILS